MTWTCSGELRKIGDANGFPNHEVLQSLPGLIRDKSDNSCVVNKAKQWSRVRNQIEWVDQIVKSSHNPRQIIIRNLLVLTALVSADQSQHGLKIRPILLKLMSGKRRSLSGGLFKKRTQTAGTDDTQFRFANRPRECLAAQSWLLIGAVPFGARFHFCFCHLTL